MKTIAQTLEVARSNVIERQKKDRPVRGPQTRPGDVDLSADIRRLVDQRPSYGYRRIAALLKRERRSAGRQPVNAKRIFRLMKKHGLLLQRYTADADQASTTARSSRSAQTSAGVPMLWSSPAGMARSCVSPSSSTATTARSSPGWQQQLESPAR